MLHYNQSDQSASPPIPTYDEAILDSNPLLGSDAEPATPSHTYKPPTVRLARGSEDSLYDRALTDDITELDTDSELGGRDGIDDLDYQDGDVELEVLGDGSTRRRRRANAGWKGRFSNLRRRVSRWTVWQRPSWLSGGMLRWQCPDVPDNWKNGTSALARLLGLFILVGLGYAFFALAIFPASQNEMAAMFDLESVRAYAQGSVKVERIREYLEHVTSFDHMAGSKGSYYLAEWMKQRYIEAGLDEVSVEEYEVYLNWPEKGGRRVAIIDPPEKRFEAILEEDPVYPDPNLVGKENTPVFHGHSRAGNVTGPLVYCNYGSRDEYRRVCSQMEIDCKGAIALVKYGGTQGDRALKVKAAEEWGIKGVLIYSDPREDGFARGKVWPDGRWRPSDGVQRGSVSLMSWVVGDVLTPGWASTPDAKRLSKDNNPGLVNIPSLPLSWRDAQKLLQSLKGHGQRVPQGWEGGVFDNEWWTGDHNSPIVWLQNEQKEKEKETIYNVMGKIEGIEPGDRKIILGNHRDSWCFGAADPGSGTAVMLELIALFGELRAQGWRPLRTIVFASWDAEEYNMIGSTEWVEDHIAELRKSGAAYINVDTGVSGSVFRASASPLLQKALLRVLDRVADPVSNQTLRQLWDMRDTQLEGLGSGSDYVAFQDLAGTSSIDISFEGEGFPYHSCYETLEWMERFGDPGLQYHATLAQVWVLLTLELSQDLLLPMGLLDYAQALDRQVKVLQGHAKSLGAPIGNGFDLSPLSNAIRQVAKSAQIREDWEIWWFGQVYGSGVLETNNLAEQRRRHNHRIINFETNLLDLPGADPERASGGSYGLPGRDQFKHVVFGPQLWSGYDEAWFPFIRDAVEAQNWVQAQAMVEKTARIITHAAEKVADKD